MNDQQRTKFLVSLAGFLLVFAIVYHIWANWGLITIHANGMPLDKVLASMSKQGHAKVETDMDGTTPVTFDVVKVTLPEALERLSGATNTRWRLIYFAAGDKTTLKMGEDAWLTDKKPDDWTMISLQNNQMGNMIVTDDDAPPVLDPRQDDYAPKKQAPAALKDYFFEAAELTNANFAYPTAWTPSLDSQPPSGPIAKVVPKMVSKAKGIEDAVFFVSNGQGRPQGPPPDFTQIDPDLIAQRVQNEINRLPPEDRTEAQNNFDSARTFFTSLQKMTDEQRQAAIAKYMQDPAVQAAMQNRMDAREGMMSHDQRMQRFQSYVNRKMAATGKM